MPADSAAFGSGCQRSNSASSSGPESSVKERVELSWAAGNASTGAGELTVGPPSGAGLFWGRWATVGNCPSAPSNHSTATTAKSSVAAAEAASTAIFVHLRNAPGQVLVGNSTRVAG